ncbi:hypothetical protein D3C72_1781620 [compost metagenome]
MSGVTLTRPMPGYWASRSLPWMVRLPVTGSWAQLSQPPSASGPLPTSMEPSSSALLPSILRRVTSLLRVTMSEWVCTSPSRRLSSPYSRGDARVPSKRASAEMIPCRVRTSGISGAKVVSLRLSNLSWPDRLPRPAGSLISISVSMLPIWREAKSIRTAACWRSKSTPSSSCW